MGGVSSVSSVPENMRRTVVAVGVSGSGKSTTCNSITATRNFLEDGGLNSTTGQAEHTDALRDDVPIRVIDTVGFLSNTDDKDTRHDKFGQFAELASYGVDVFLLVERFGRWTDANERHFKLFTELAGPEALKHTVLVFTHISNDDLQRQLKEKVPDGLNAVLRQVAGVVGVENKMNSKAASTDVCKVVRDLVKTNEGERYANATLTNASQRRENLQARISALKNPYARHSLEHKRKGLNDGSYSYDELVKALKRAEVDDGFVFKLALCCGAEQIGS
jgi:GTP-binding protein EngB required for normal cell division